MNTAKHTPTPITGDPQSFCDYGNDSDGPNMPPIPDDKYAPRESVYVFDITKDARSVARVARAILAKLESL